MIVAVPAVCPEQIQWKSLLLFNVEKLFLSLVL